MKKGKLQSLPTTIGIGSFTINGERCKADSIQCRPPEPRLKCFFGNDIELKSQSPLLKWARQFGRTRHCFLHSPFFCWSQLSLDSAWKCIETNIKTWTRENMMIKVCIELSTIEAFRFRTTEPARKRNDQECVQITRPRWQSHENGGVPLLLSENFWSVFTLDASIVNWSPTISYSCVWLQSKWLRSVIYTEFCAILLSPGGTVPELHHSAYTQNITRDICAFSAGTLNICWQWVEPRRKLYPNTKSTVL